MEIEFSWKMDQWRGKILPTILPNDFSEMDCRKYLGFLNDDGGMEYDVYIPYFIELREKIQKFNRPLKKST